MHFKQYFYETLRMDDARARSMLRQHPLVQQGTFGVEIEFIALGIPYEAWDNKFIMKMLLKSKYADDLFKQYGRIETYHNGRAEYEPMSSSEWSEFLKGYIIDHKKEVIQSCLAELGHMTESNQFVDSVIKYWKDIVKKIIQNVGFGVRDGLSNGTTWGVGDDGFDSEDKKPVIEIRTGILSQEDMSGLEKVLIELRNLFKTNAEYLRLAGNTGLHVHVSNPAINQSGGPDPFTRLASIASIDEDKIWNDMAPHDRAFERFAVLNRQQDFSNYNDRGLHQMVIKLASDLNPDKNKQNKGPVHFSVNVSSQELSQFIYGIDRNVGINTRSRQPTVEYRQLSSALLMDQNGPQKVLDYIRYFLENTAGLSNKNQFVIKDENIRVVFTRIQGGAKIDFQRRSAEDDRFSSVSQTGNKTDQLRNFSSDQTPPWQTNRIANAAALNKHSVFTKTTTDPDVAASQFRNMFK